MCRGLDHENFRRCEPNDRSRAMAAARRRLLRYEEELQRRKKEKTLSKEREYVLIDRMLKAKADLEQARSMLSPTQKKKRLKAFD